MHHLWFFAFEVEFVVHIETTYGSIFIEMKAPVESLPGDFNPMNQ